MNKFELFQRYLEICNHALEVNKNRFPFKQILEAAQKADNSAPRLVEVSIIEDHPVEKFAILLDKNTRVVGKKHENCDNCQCQGEWRITQSYLEDVVNNPDAYISNPAKIDWEWIQAGSGIGKTIN